MPNTSDEQLSSRSHGRRDGTNTSSTEELDTLQLEEVLYSSSSFHAVVTPVTLTMILTALAVIYVNDTDYAREATAALSRAYVAFDNTSSDSNATTLGLSLINALIIVSVIGAMTFVIVLLYKYRCMSCLLGYMILSSGLLLGFLGQQMFRVAINRYRIPIDVISFYICLANFSLVGVFSIFWQKGGVPSFITQGYLVATSVILAWQLSFFDSWTSWTLLIMLAIYDLCAVLTPCGPLKALVNLMSQEGSPSMPGLLYEAELPPEARRPRRHRERTNGSSNQEPPSNSSTDEAVRTSQRDGRRERRNQSDRDSEAASIPPRVSATLPFAIAKLYRLEIAEPIIPAESNFTPLLDDAGNPVEESNVSMRYTVEQLHQEVEAYFPRGGGRIERTTNDFGETRYEVRDRFGEVKRTLFVHEDGRVFEEREGDDDDGDGKRGRNSIKLGLGDFIFYSVLVANAILYSFTTFISCMLVVLAGLGGTLVLLSVYRHALPALPISIFLGVMFYLLTRLIIEPYIEELMRLPYYV